MDTRSLSVAEKTTLLTNFQAITDWKEIGPFCVDGRDGEVEFSDAAAENHLFVQALGGTLLIAVIHYIRDGGNFAEVLGKDIKALQAAGFGCGVHRGSHAHEDVSDCGFADNLQRIITRFVEKQTDIAQLIDAAATGVRNEMLWASVVSDARERSSQSVPSGETMIASCKENGANLQTLVADHAEIAAIVNLSPNTTFNTQRVVEAGLQAFNLDLWYVLEQAKILELDTDYVTHAALGLYVATEMVLVEDKKQIRLPILIHS